MKEECFPISHGNVLLFIIFAGSLELLGSLVMLLLVLELMMMMWIPETTDRSRTAMSPTSVLQHVATCLEDKTCRII